MVASGRGRRCGVAAPDRHGSLCPDLSDEAEPDSLALTLLRVAPFTVFGTAKQRSSRCAAALIITSYASVSLTLVIQPLLPSRRPDYLGPSPERAPDREITPHIPSECARLLVRPPPR